MGPERQTAGTWGHSQDSPGLKEAALELAMKGRQSSSCLNILFFFFFKLLINTGQVKILRIRDKESAKDNLMEVFLLS